MTEPNLRERMAEAMKERASRPLYNIPSLDPVLVGSLGDAWPYLADAALSALLSPPITEEEVEAVARAIADGWHDPIIRWNAEANLPPHRRPPWDSEAHVWRPLARAAIIAYRTVIGRKG